MKITLKTDFIDCYDFWFDRHCSEDEPVIKFHRFSRTSMGRQQAFSRLEQMKEPVVPHGYLHDMQERFSGDFVAYTDEHAHQGDGKKIVKGEDSHPNVFSSLYISRHPSKSLRKLVVGRKVFYLTYKSDHPWKSNVGNVDITYEGREEQDYGDYPLYAVDYVIGDTAWAVDLNTAPLIKHTDIDISNEDIVKEIKGWYERIYEL